MSAGHRLEGLELSFKIIDVLGVLDILGGRRGLS